MKKSLIALCVSILPISAMAEGYQVNTFSARQEGMGHVGVAMKLGSESQIFNPGALAFSTDRFEISAGMSAIKATADATLPDGSKYTSSNKVSTPMNVSASFRIYDNLYAGVTLFTPYGSSINWGTAWPGAILNESVDLKVFTVQPTVSWKILKNLSVGAGLMISWGNVNLNKGLITPQSMNMLLNVMNLSANLQGNPGYQPYGELPPASVNLNGDSQLALGVNVGVLWDVLPNLSLGASFRSKMNMHVGAGNASVNYANEQARLILGETLENINYANFSASMPCPYVLTFGVAYKPIPKLLLAFDAQLNGWSTYKELDINFEGYPQYDQHLPKNYSNAMTYHVGAEYNLTDRLDLRCGLMIDTSPCSKEHYNPETPGMTKIEPSLGLSFRPIKGLSVDVAFMYVHGCGATGTGEYKNMLADTYNGLISSVNPILPPVMTPFPEMPATGSFTADYRTHAIIPAIGLSYSF